MKQQVHKIQQRFLDLKSDFFHSYKVVYLHFLQKCKLLFISQKIFHVATILVSCHLGNLQATDYKGMKSQQLF